MIVKASKLVCRVGCLFGGLVLAGGVSASGPNILFVVADDLGWDDVGYHNPQMRTPTIDALAKAGVELDCHYVQPQCTPTRVALMTGRYPSRFGLHCCHATNVECFPVGTLTLARVMQQAGYATGMSGKWHMGSKPDWGPNHHGFDYSHGSLAGAVGMYDHRYRLNSPFADTWHRNLERIQEDGHVTDLTAGETVRWIKSHASSEEPWFFYVPFHAVHTPLVERDQRWHEINSHLDSADRRLYAAAASHMDDAIRQMVEALDQTGQRERTLIVFTSDNGAQVHHAGNTYPPPDPKLRNFSSNAPLRGSKTQTYEGGYRVPAFVNWPAKLEARQVTAPMHVVDWVPTLAKLIGYQSDRDTAWDGQDAWPLVTGEQTASEDRTLYTVWGDRRQRESLRHGDWKIVRSRGPKWELYRLSSDPYEKQNLASTEPEVFSRLMQRYQQQRALDAESFGR